MLGRKLNVADLHYYFTDSSDEQILDAYTRALASARSANVPFIPAFEVEEIDGRTRVGIRVELGTTMA